MDIYLDQQPSEQKENRASRGVTSDLKFTFECVVCFVSDLRIAAAAEESPLLLQFGIVLAALLS